MAQDVIAGYLKNGVFVPITEKNPLPTGPVGAATDAFGNARVTTPTSVFGIQQQYNKQPLFYEETLANGGTSTHLPNESSVRMNVTSTAGSTVVRQTRQYFRYQTGKSQLPKETFVFGPTTATKEVGWGDAENGIFFRYDGTTVSMVLRTFISGSVVEEAVAQADWNVDKLDGSGVSGITLDPEKGQITTPDAEWLGTGNVRAALNINNMATICHMFEGSNKKSAVYMTTANLPLRWSIVSDGANADSMKHICGSIDSEGGLVEELGIPFVAESGLTTITASTEEVVLVLRPRTTFNSIANRTNVILEAFDAFAEDQPCIARAYYNPTLSATPAFTDIDTSESTLEFAAAAATSGITVSSGRPVDSVFIPAASAQGNRTTPAVGTGALLSKLPFTLDIDGANPDFIAITIENTTITDVTAGATIKGKDVY